MPHFGLIDEEKLGPVQSLLMRARLHIRGGRLRLQQRQISLGIITLYDALCTALQWYISVPENIHNLGIVADEIIKDEKAIVRPQAGDVIFRKTGKDFPVKVHGKIKMQMSADHILHIGIRMTVLSRSCSHKSS